MSIGDRKRRGGRSNVHSKKMKGKLCVVRRVKSRSKSASGEIEINGMLNIVFVHRRYSGLDNMAWMWG
jgi:hypothetical protein